MELRKVTKGRFSTKQTEDKYDPLKNLTFHIKCNSKYVEMAINGINRGSINLLCVKYAVSKMNPF